MVPKIIMSIALNLMSLPKTKIGLTCKKRDELIPKLTGKAAQVLARVAENHDVITYQILDEALVKGCSVRKSQHQKEAEFYNKNRISQRRTSLARLKS